MTALVPCRGGGHDNLSTHVVSLAVTNRRRSKISMAEIDVSEAEISFLGGKVPEMEEIFFVLRNDVNIVSFSDVSPQKMDSSTGAYQNCHGTRT